MTHACGADDNAALHLTGLADTAGVRSGMTLDDRAVLWQRCEGRCAVSGLEFSDEVIFQPCEIADMTPEDMGGYFSVK